MFRSKKALENHTYLHTEQNLFECGECGKRLRNPATLEKHRLNFHSESTELECAHCGERCASRVALKQHLALHGSVCKTCSEVFSSQELLLEHAKTHTKTKCDFCGKDYSTDNALKLHIKRIHLKELDFMCNQCDKKFTSKADLKNHINSRHEEPESKLVFVCDTCGKSYATSVKLKNHILYDHQQKAGIFILPRARNLIWGKISIIRVKKQLFR